MGQVEEYSSTRRLSEFGAAPRPGRRPPRKSPGIGLDEAIVLDAGCASSALVTSGIPEDLFSGRASYDARLFLLEWDPGVSGSIPGS